MFFPSYDDYMRDIFYYNNMVTPGMSYNPNNVANLNNMYPSIYRIIYPVVERVVSGSNFQFANEDMVSNSVETVYNIVEGDVTSSLNSENQNTGNSNNMNNSSKRDNPLLKSLIKILIIRELISKSNIRRFPFNNQAPYYLANYPISMPY